MVPRVGIEPTLLAEPDFESGASTNFTTEAFSKTASLPELDADTLLKRWCVACKRFTAYAVRH